MAMIRGVEFDDSVASIVQELIDRLIEECDDRCYNSNDKQLRFALRPPAETKHNIAYRIFIQIKPTVDGGAKVRRPASPKSGDLLISLTRETLDQAVNAGITWYYEVQGSKPPTRYQGTGDARVLSGGQFESNRSKH